MIFCKDRIDTLHDNVKGIQTMSIGNRHLSGAKFITVDNGIGAGTLLDGCNFFIRAFPLKAVDDRRFTIAHCNGNVFILPLVNRYDIGIGGKVGQSFQLFRRVCDKEEYFAGKRAVFIFYFDLRLSCLYRCYDAYPFISA